MSLGENVSYQVKPDEDNNADDLVVKRDDADEVDEDAASSSEVGSLPESLPTLTNPSQNFNKSMQKL